jgi:hypothetical protein
MLGTTYSELTKYPGEEATTFVLVVKCRLTKKLAESLQCAEMCFDSNGVPRPFEGKVGLKAIIRDASVELGDRSFDASLIHKFKVGRPSGAADNDVSLDVSCRIHFAGANPHLEAFCEDQNKATFGLVISAKQEAFNFDGAKEDDEDVQEEPDAETARVTAAPGTLARKGAMKDPVN